MAHIASRTQFARNLTTGWGLLVAEVGVAFFLTPFIILKLGAGAYGVWSLMIGLIGYMGLVDVGLRGAVGRFVNHYLALGDRRALDEVVSTACGVLTALAAVALLAAIVVSRNFTTIFPRTPEGLADAVVIALPLLAVGLWMSFISSILGNLLAAKEALYLTNGFALVTLALRASGVVLVLTAGYGIDKLVIVQILTGVVGLCLSFLAVHRAFGEGRPRLVGFSILRLQEMWRYGVASFVSRTASTMANDSAPIIGMWILGPEAVAIYSVALTLTQNARRLQDSANSAIFPSVMKAGAIKDYAGLRALYLRFMDISFAIGSLAFIGLIVFGHDFLRLWVGPHFVDASAVVSIVAFGYLMQGIASTAPISLHAVNRVGVTVKIGLWEAAACVVLTAALPGLFGLGLVGMALGTTLPRLASNVLVYPVQAVRLMGPELRRSLLPAIGRNLAFCAVLGLAFLTIHVCLPGRNWGLLMASVATTIVLHLLMVGMRYEGVPLLSPLTDPLRRFVWRHR